MGTEEATFVDWIVGDGDPVSVGDPIYSVETEKVETEVEAAASGVLRHGDVEADETYPVGTEVGWIETS
ncbi:biotin-requiring enzyme family protein [Nakamurella sp. YIM 132087]|uniref:Biotin-requiring enzyme family protein n=2 Tax=Nakamurella alba TaxID=2665158 RepID=A0A7K1FM03_9ACTN|nr:biotin-requiring enzyme family protein [Nakamurella alba]